MATCTRCGADASGKFCSTCGASLGGAACTHCGARLTTGARFCHACGQPLGAAGRPAGVPPWLPWALTGMLVVALIVVMVARTSPAASPVAAVPNPGAGAGQIVRAPDISQMTPRQRADALFNRVMAAHEREFTDSVAFFTPMAIAAYQMAGPLDPDGHYHIGLIQAIAGNVDAARAHADTIARNAPRHLYAAIVRIEAARQAGDAAARRRAGEAFLSAYDAEVAQNRPEYADHPGMLERYRLQIEADR